MKPMKLRVATCQSLPEPDPDAAPLAVALAAAGFEAELAAWDDPTVDWSQPVPTILRSTWNYALELPRFLAWIDRVAAVAPLHNPADLVHGNVRKRYLLELAARGVPVVPTRLIEPGGSTDVVELAAALDTQRVVIKPEIGAGSLDARAFTLDTPDAAVAAVAHLVELLERGAALVQPYVASVDDYGERSLVWIDGEFSHEVRKTARFAGDLERIDGPYPIAADERAVATMALGPHAARVLYGRVDLARNAQGQPMVMELELVEPSLFFARRPGSADRFARGLARRLGA